MGKAGDSETKGRFKIEEATGEEKSEKRGPWRQFRGLAQVELLLSIAPLVAGLVET